MDTDTPQKVTMTHDEWVRIIGTLIAAGRQDLADAIVAQVA